MADGVQQRRKLSREEAILLARKGKDEWNKWARENPGVDVSFSNFDFTQKDMPFSGFIFPGRVYFSQCQFSSVDFSNTRFRGAAFFEEVKFWQGVDFSKARFRGVAYFRRAESRGYTTFKGVKFFGEKAYFGQTKFLGAYTCFDDVEFRGGDTDFRLSHFGGGGVTFELTQFGGDTFFQKAVFENTVHLNYAHFYQRADFSTVDFQHAVYLGGAEFDRVPDFRYTTLVRHLSLHGMNVHYSDQKERERFLGFKCKKATAGDDADKFRRLKEMAINSKDHDRELDFFASELKAKRFYETKHWGGLMWSYLYQGFSDFGQVVWRPAVALILLWFLSGGVYWIVAESSAVGPLKNFGDALRLSAAMAVPFVAAIRASYEDVLDRLFGGDLGFWLSSFAFFEGVFGLVFVFLIGLALRNRFRI